MYVMPTKLTIWTAKMSGTRGTLIINVVNLRWQLAPEVHGELGTLTRRRRISGILGKGHRAKLGHGKRAQQYDAHVVNHRAHHRFADPDGTKGVAEWRGPDRLAPYCRFRVVIPSLHFVYGDEKHSHADFDRALDHARKEPKRP